MNEIKRIFRPERGFGFVEMLDGYIFTPEANAHKFIITQMVKANGEETEQAFAAGSIVSCRFLKSDKVTELLEGTLEDGAACVTLKPECYSVPGRFLITILVTSGSSVTCVYAASGTVIGADSENVNISEGASREIDEKIAEINAAAATAQAAVSQVQAAVAGVPAVIASIPQDYTTLSNSVGDLKSAVLRNEGFSDSVEWPADGEGKSINASGVEGTTTGFHVTGFMSVIPGNYVYERTTTGLSSGTTARIHGYTATDNSSWDSQLTSGSIGNGTKRIPFTVPNGIKYIRISCTNQGTYTEKLTLVGNLSDQVDDLNHLKEDSGISKNQLSGHDVGNNMYDGTWGWIQGNYNSTDTYLVHGPYINVTAGSSYTFGLADYDSGLTITYCSARFFDSSKAAIGDAISTNPGSGQLVTAPSGAAYMMLILNTGNVSTPISPAMIKESYAHTIIVKGTISDKAYTSDSNICSLKFWDWSRTRDLIGMDYIDNSPFYLYRKLEPKDVVFEYGGIQIANGRDIAEVSTSRMRMTDYVWMEKGAVISVDSASSYTFCVFMYSESPTPVETTDARVTAMFIGASGDANTPFRSDPYIIPQGCYVRIVIAGSSALPAGAKFSIEFHNCYTPHLSRLVKPTKGREIYGAPGGMYKYTWDVISPVPGAEGNLSNIYAMWDALVTAHSDFMERTTLGTDESGDYNVYQYTINSHTDRWWRPNGEYKTGDKNLKIIWVGTMHGDEPYQQYEDYYFFKDLLEHHDTDPVLQMIWCNTNFVIVPVANPWGYDHNKRYNYNTDEHPGVNINRNFPFEWELTDPDEDPQNYSGPSPASEQETQNLMKLVLSNDDAYFVVNRHGTGILAVWGLFGYTTSRYETDREVGQALAKQIDTYMKANYAWAREGVQNNEPNIGHAIYTWRRAKELHGAFDSWANYRGYHGILIESGNTLDKAGETSVYSNYQNTVQDVNRIDTTAVGNIIAAYVLNNKFVLSSDMMWQERI